MLKENYECKTDHITFLYLSKFVIIRIYNFYFTFSKKQQVLDGTFFIMLTNKTFKTAIKDLLIFECLYCPTRPPPPGYFGF